MESLYIEGTKKTPEVSFNIDGHLRIKGRSIPEDASKFYDALYLWVFDYSTNPQSATQVDIELEYFNSATSKSLLHILRELVEIGRRGSQVLISWYYENGDEDIFERGQYYSSILDTKFNFVELD